ncbi:hypothetical protein J2S19_002121 [Metabacillus malikii]|uniref:ABC transporter permease n=2 Tax=Metabacillus malikii TaxID=1504265 RepID=A0ABT9ZF52_9BACI|nr:hypothetical protein [Metabacillus malikii]
MNIMNLYIQEVVRRLPEKGREDIALELKSTIEDMLPDEYSEQDVKAVLATLGNPRDLANNYLDRPKFLIGPNYYDVYMNLLKMIIPIAAIISMSSVITNHVISYNGEEALLNLIFEIVGLGIWQGISVSIQVFFWLTITFAIIERVDPNVKYATMTGKEWTPDDLKLMPYVEAENRIPVSEIFLGLLWTAIWGSVYFTASQLIGIYQSSGDKLEFITPTFNQEILLSYWPFVALLIGMEIVISTWKYCIRHWTMKLATFNSLYHLLATVIFIVIVSNPNLITPTFIEYFTNMFSADNGWENWIRPLSIFTFIVFAGVDALSGYRKAKKVKKLKLD